MMYVNIQEILTFPPNWFTDPMLPWGIVIRPLYLRRSALVAVAPRLFELTGTSIIVARLSIRLDVEHGLDRNSENSVSYYNCHVKVAVWSTFQNLCLTPSAVLAVARVLTHILNSQCPGVFTM
jgi:hypothetical protein